MLEIGSGQTNKAVISLSKYACKRVNIGYLLIMCVTVRRFFFRTGLSFFKNPHKTCFFCASVHVDIKNDYKTYMFTCLHVYMFYAHI